MKRCSKCAVEKEATKEFFYTYKYKGKERLKSQCKVCHIADCVARASSDPEKNNERSRVWRQENHDQWQATVRARYASNPEKIDTYARWTRYRIKFRELWDAQNGMCASCGEFMLPKGKDPKSVCVDHDRSCCPGGKSCGKCVRGLIHRNCNLVLGYAKDDIEVLEKAVEYLKRWKSQRGE